MRYETDVSAEDTADKIRPLLPQAKKAYGSQGPSSPARIASDEVNKVLLQYVNNGGSIATLGVELRGDISVAGLRRRIRVARALEQAALEGDEQVMGRVKRPKGKRDPKLVRKAAKDIEKARELGGRLYGDAVREAYDEGLSLEAIAKEMGVSSYSLWSARRTSW